MNSNSIVRRPVVLCVMDGWGYREDPKDNAIAIAHTPNYDRLLRSCPTGFLVTSSVEVGLPEGQMGNSEVGHMNLGAGRTVQQVLPLIDAATDTRFAHNDGMTQLVQALKDSGGRCHLMGLLSPGGVHSHMSHLAHVAHAVASHGIPVLFHIFTDGRDTPPQSALEYLDWLESELAGLDGVKIATVTGRYFTMDRDNRWERASRGYQAVAEGHGLEAANARDAIEDGYARDETDEFLQPTIIGNFDGMVDGDGFMMVNFRADRARQILSALVEPKFSGFARDRQIKFAAAAGMAAYSDRLSELMITLFPHKPIKNTMGDLLARAGCRQLRIAETEKYAHVTFFFNGGDEAVFAGEDRVLVPSPKVRTYDLKPAMSAPELTDRLEEAIQSDTYDFVLVNYANADMVGHSGDLRAAVQAVETVDMCLGRLETAVTRAGGVLFVTADHGNAEVMRDADTGVPHTAHTTFPVPAILVNAPSHITGLTNGRLADVAPTLLPFLGIEQPDDMTGKSLLITSGAKAD
jgi:2,3-bisphosphoglycerate-independent phosphoglycerate mutase